MESKIIRECDMFGRVLIFWTVNQADIPAGSKGATYYSNLASDNQKLLDAGATQKGSKVTAQNARIRALDLTLMNITRTAHAIAQDVPGFDDRFGRPDHLTPHEVVATAQVYLVQLAADPADTPETQAAKAARVAEFTGHGLPATFVADLQAQLDAIGTLKDTHEASREQGVGSTSVLAHLARDGRKQVKYLDAIAHNLYAQNPEKLSAWLSASHVERDPVHARVTPASATPAAATAK